MIAVEFASGGGLPLDLVAIFTDRQQLIRVQYPSSLKNSMLIRCEFYGQLLMILAKSGSKRAMLCGTLNHISQGKPHEMLEVTMEISHSFDDGESPDVLVCHAERGLCLLGALNTVRVFEVDCE